MTSNDSGSVKVVRNQKKSVSGLEGMKDAAINRMLKEQNGLMISGEIISEPEKIGIDAIVEIKNAEGTFNIRIPNYFHANRVETARTFAPGTHYLFNCVISQQRNPKAETSRDYRIISRHYYEIESGANQGVNKLSLFGLITAVYPEKDGYSYFRVTARGVNVRLSKIDEGTPDMLHTVSYVKQGDIVVKTRTPSGKSEYKVGAVVFLTARVHSKESVSPGDEEYYAEVHAGSDSVTITRKAKYDN